MKVAIIGGGLIGGGWAARFLLNGHDVMVHDPSPGAERRLVQVLDSARECLPALYDRPLPREGRLRWASTVGEAVADAEWVQESVPERLEVKRKVYAEIEPDLGDRAILASSTSGFLPSDLQSESTRPEQLIVAHPFNPVYLIPLVEIVGSDRTPEVVKSRAADVVRSIGMHPLILKREIPGFIGNRLQEAIWRETLWMIKDGIATTQQIDEAILYGFGLRLAQMGQFETFRLGGGEAGMRHFLAQFGPSLKEPLTHLMDVPDLDGKLVDTIAEQSDQQSGQVTIPEMEKARDRNLVALVRALKERRAGAGKTARSHEEGL